MLRRSENFEEGGVGAKINNHGQTRGKKIFATAWHFSRRASVAAHKEVWAPAQWDSGIIYISLPTPAQHHNSSSSSIADQLLMAQDMGSKYAEGTCFEVSIRKLYAWQWFSGTTRKVQRGFRG